MPDNEYAMSDMTELTDAINRIRRHYYVASPLEIDLWDSDYVDYVLDGYRDNLFVKREVRIGKRLWAYRDDMEYVNPEDR